MNYTDIPLGVKEQICVSDGSDMQAKFISRVMKTGDKSLLVIPFMHKGVRVNFNGQNIHINMEVPDGEGNNWTFKNCKIDTIKKNGLIYHSRQEFIDFAYRLLREDDLRKGMARCSREKAEAFSYDVFASSMIKVYADALHEAAQNGA